MLKIVPSNQFKKDLKLAKNEAVKWNIFILLTKMHLSCFCFVQEHIRICFNSFDLGRCCGTDV